MASLGPTAAVPLAPHCLMVMGTREGCAGGMYASGTARNPPWMLGRGGPRRGGGSGLALTPLLSHRR